MNCVISIVGPTGVGKSRLALELARKFDGEIINADSRQVYRFMDIGTAKPLKSDRKLIPHYLFDIISPDESFSLAIYQKRAMTKIHEIQKRNIIPLLVGGSGLYIWSVLEGWMIPRVPPDIELRQVLEKRAKIEGFDVLFRELQELDPEASQKIMPSNVRRVIRALEIYYGSKQKASQLQAKRPPNFSTLIIGLTMPRQQLYRTIDTRVEKMIQQGFIKEVSELLDKGYSSELPSMSGIGYRQLSQYIQGKLSLKDAITKIKFATHQFARRQYAWFHLNDDRIHWFDVSTDIKDNINSLVSDFINKC